MSRKMERGGIMVTREEFYVNSTDGIHMIHGYRWYDTGKKFKGVLQLVHGMLEYIERYEEIAEYMAQEGYFVIGHDHLGHGDSVNGPDELGYVSEDGAANWVKDIGLVRKMAATYALDVPYFMLGHSMGSFLVRRYLIYHGDKVDGALLLGTGHPSRALIRSGLAVTGALKLKAGGRGNSRFLDLMTCTGYAKRYPNNAKDGSWLSRDPQVLVHALMDPKQHFRFSLNAYGALFETMDEVTQEKRMKKMPKNLSLMILSGGDDLVGEKGKGIQRLENALNRIGMKDVTCILYPDGRHELLNDLDKQQVLQDIRLWCNAITAEKEG